MTTCQRSADSLCGDDAYQIKIDKADIYGQCGGATMLDRTMVEGDTVSWRATWVDPDGDPVDFTQGTRYGQLRIFRTEGVVLKDTRVGSDWVWTNQALGEGYWTFTSDETDGWEPEDTSLESYFYDEATTPETVHWMGTARCEIRETGTSQLP